MKRPKPNFYLSEDEVVYLTAALAYRLEDLRKEPDATVPGKSTKDLIHSYEVLFQKLTS